MTRHEHELLARVHRAAQDASDRGVEPLAISVALLSMSMQIVADAMGLGEGAAERMACACSDAMEAQVKAEFASGNYEADR